MKIILILIFLVLFFSGCSKEQFKKNDNTSNNKTFIEEEKEDTTSLTPQEVFSSSLMEDILSQYDEDLEGYLEDEIFPIAGKSEKVTIDKLSSSLYLFTYEDKGTEKNLLLQKYYNSSKDEFFFVKKEINSNIIKQVIK